MDNLFVEGKKMGIVPSHGFEWIDLVAYTLGVGTVLLLKWVSSRKIANFTKDAANEK